LRISDSTLEQDFVPVRSKNSAASRLCCWPAKKKTSLPPLMWDGILADFSPTTPFYFLTAFDI